MPDRVAFVGLGNMGTPMSRRLLAAGHERHGLERGHVVQRLRPILEVGVAGVRRRVEFDEVAAEQHALLR